MFIGESKVHMYLNTVINYSAIFKLLPVKPVLYAITDF